LFGLIFFPPFVSTLLCVLSALEPPMGHTVHWSCLLVMKSEVALCTDDRQRGKKRFCLLCSTNRCSISDGMVHILLPDVDALYSWEPELRLRASDFGVIATDGFSLILAYNHCLI